MWKWHKLSNSSLFRDFIDNWPRKVNRFRTVGWKSGNILPRIPAPTELRINSIRLNKWKLFIPFLKTRGNFEAFEPKMGVLRPLFTEIWTIEILHFFEKKSWKVGNLAVLKRLNYLSQTWLTDRPSNSLYQKEKLFIPDFLILLVTWNVI